MEEIKQGISSIQKEAAKVSSQKGSTGKKNEIRSNWLECRLCTADQLPVWHFKVLDSIYLLIYS
jgi:hypothetical protein